MSRCPRRCVRTCQLPVSHSTAVNEAFVAVAIRCHHCSDATEHRVPHNEKYRQGDRRMNSLNDVQGRGRAMACLRTRCRNKPGRYPAAEVETFPFDVRAALKPAWLEPARHWISRYKRREAFVLLQDVRGDLSECARGRTWREATCRVDLLPCDLQELVSVRFVVRNEANSSFRRGSARQVAKAFRLPVRAGLVECFSKAESPVVQGSFLCAHTTIERGPQPPSRDMSPTGGSSSPRWRNSPQTPQSAGCSRTI
jgi:hypothetical protein